MIILQPSLRFSVETYIRPFQLDNVLHILKPTIPVSPFGYVFVHLTLLPHKNLSQTQTQLSLELQTQFSLTLHARGWNKQQSENVTVTGTEQLRQQVSLPIRQTRCLDVYCSKGTIFTSATLFDRKGEVHFFQSVDPSPVVTPESLAAQTISPILMLVPVACASADYLTVISAAYERADKALLLRWSVMSGFILLFFLWVLRSIKMI